MTDLRADGNNNGEIDTGDYVIWRQNLTNPAAGGSSLASGSSSGVSSVATATSAAQAKRITAARLWAEDSELEYREFARLAGLAERVGIIGALPGGWLRIR